MKRFFAIATLCLVAFALFSCGGNSGAEAQASATADTAAVAGVGADIGASSLSTIDPKVFGEYNTVVGKYSALIDKFVAEANAAKDAKSFAVAIRSYTKEGAAVMVELDAFMKKYPEFEALSETNVPPEIADAQKKLNNSVVNLMGIADKMVQYQDDPEVKTALDEMQKLSS